MLLNTVLYNRFGASSVLELGYYRLNNDKTLLARIYTAKDLNCVTLFDSLSAGEDEGLVFKAGGSGYPPVASAARGGVT